MSDVKILYGIPGKSDSWVPQWVWYLWSLPSCFTIAEKSMDKFWAFVIFLCLGIVLDTIRYPLWFILDKDRYFYAAAVTNDDTFIWANDGRKYLKQNDDIFDERARDVYYVPGWKWVYGLRIRNQMLPSNRDKFLEIESKFQNVSSKGMLSLVNKE